MYWTTRSNAGWPSRPRPAKTCGATCCATTAPVDRFYPDREGRWGWHSEPMHFLAKVETHNHPTEIEPFGGAATCLGLLVGAGLFSVTGADRAGAWARGAAAC